MSKTSYEFGDFRFDASRRRLERKDGEVLHLPPKAIDILQILIERAGETVEKNTLMEIVWANSFVEESNLTQTIYLLRKALGENAAGQNYIQTLPKRGYRFVADVAESNGNITAINKIAVLPFENRSGDVENERLAEGLSENLIDVLSQIPNIKVIARSSAFRYKNSDGGFEEIADSLGVKFVLEGRITQRVEKTQIRAELVDVENEVQLWGKTIECRICDLQKVLQEILHGVLEKLTPGLSSAQKNLISKPHTVNDEAYQTYLSGLFLFRQGGVENFYKALEYYDKATELDPNFALAYALKPAIYAFLTEGYMDKTEAFEKARFAAERALEIDKELPQTHIARAIIKKWELDLAGAIRDYQRSFELNPNNSSAHNNYALILSAFGQHDEALEEIELARTLDPLVPYIEINKSWILNNAGRFDESLRLLEKLLEENPDLTLIYEFVGAAYEGKKMYREAICANEKMLDEKPLYVYAQADIIYNLFKSGETEKARKLFKKLQTETEYIAPLKLAAIYEIDDNREAALNAIEEGFERRDSEMHSLFSDRRLKSLHDEPRFQSLLRKIGKSSE